MTAYIALMAFVTALAFAALLVPKYTHLLAGIAAIAMALFAGLRFETGYDFIGYGLIFDGTPTLHGFLCDGAVPKFPAEPLFIALNSAVKSLGLGLNSIFLTVALFSVGSLYLYGYKTAPRAMFVMLLAYLGICFLIAQMALVRQAIASGVVMLALLLAFRKKTFSAAALVFAAPLFQASAAVFVPLPFLLVRRPAAAFSWAIVAAGLIIYVSGFDLFHFIAHAVASMDIPYLSRKFETYSTMVTPPPSKAALAVLLAQMAFLYFIYRVKDDSKTLAINLSIWLTLAMLVAMLYFSGLPSLWNRIMLVAVPVQALMLGHTQSISVQRLATLTCFTALLGTSVLIYFLSKPELAPFIPYNSVAQVALGAPHGDGYERQAAYYQRFELKNPEIVELQKRRAAEYAAMERGKEKSSPAEPKPATGRWLCGS